jgi:hypothetical protein
MVNGRDLGIRVSDLWRWDGTVDRGPYVVIGVAAFAIKHNLDRLVATLVFHKPWGIFNYIVPPRQGGSLFSLAPGDRALYATLLVLALPFIWTGVVLTLRRLRAAGLPVGLVSFFFVPVVNLLFFLLLALLPSRPRDDGDGRAPGALGRVIPESVLGSALMAVLFAVAAGFLVTLFGVGVLARYGWGLFVGVPFCLGFGSALLHGYHRPRSFGSCLAVAGLSLVLLATLLLALAVEGTVCLMMAGPIAGALATLGGILGYFVQRRPWQRGAPASAMLSVFLVPSLLMGVEDAARPEAPLIEVRTTVEIDAPPETVWIHVVSFGELPAPTEWIFRTGIAYPIRATIEGRGAGAVRRCVFSTGAFVELIEAWDEPRRLAFSVRSQPAPMEEWTPYPAVRPPHLDGYLRSERGEFVITPLPGRRARLEGTTWYRHDLWPTAYWRLWSDAAIHRIHGRVLRHIKALAETKTDAALGG